MTTSTANIGLKKMTSEEVVNIDKITNENMDLIDEQLGDIAKQLSNYNSYASAKDGNGIYTVVEYKRFDNTLYMKSTLSNVDTNGNYQTIIWEFYNTNGVEIIKTIVWTITYDSDGAIISKVVA